MSYMHSTSVRDSPSNLDMESRFWSSIHKLLVQPKVQMFLWWDTLNVLLTRMNLMRRGIEDKIVCVYYGFQYKDDHILLDCVFAKDVWNQLPIGNKYTQILALSFKDLLHTHLFAIYGKISYYFCHSYMVDLVCLQ